MQINLDPKERISEDDLRRGLNYLKIDGIFSQSLGILISGTFIVPLLLLMGATSFHVGLLFSMASLASFSQLLALDLMNKFHGRKKVAVVFSTLARCDLLVLSIILILGVAVNVTTILIGLSFFYLLANISSCAFNYWMLEFVPKSIRGRYFASRTRISLFIGSVIGLIVAVCIESITGGSSGVSYSFVILIASILGLLGVYFLAKIPEPKFNGSEPLSKRFLGEFLKIRDLRKHFEAIFFLYLAINLSAPFFVYYMLTRLKLTISMVFIVTMIGQFCTILLLPKWGTLIDKYGVKPVLRFSTYVVILTLLIWPFTTLPEKHIFSIPLLLIIYILMGSTMGGLNLSSNLIAYNLSKGKRVTYGLSLNSISISLGSAVGSFLGALLSIPASYAELSMTFNIYTASKITIFIIDIKGLDFIFITSALLGAVSLSLLRSYKIETEIDEDKKYTELVIGFKRYIRGSMDHILVVVSRKTRNLKHMISIKKTRYSVSERKVSAKPP